MSCISGERYGQGFLKYNYERTPNELAPETECPQCGAIYAKIEKALRPPEAVPPPGVASQTPESPEQKMVELTANRAETGKYELHFFAMTHI